MGISWLSFKKEKETYGSWTKTECSKVFATNWECSYGRCKGNWLSCAAYSFSGWVNIHPYKHCNATVEKTSLARDCNNWTLKTRGLRRKKFQCTTWEKNGDCTVHSSLEAVYFTASMPCGAVTLPLYHCTVEFWNFLRGSMLCALMQMIFRKGLKFEHKFTQ